MKRSALEKLDQGRAKEEEATDTVVMVVSLFTLDKKIFSKNNSVQIYLFTKLNWLKLSKYCTRLPSENPNDSNTQLIRFLNSPIDLISLTFSGDEFT